MRNVWKRAFRNDGCLKCKKQAKLPCHSMNKFNAIHLSPEGLFTYGLQRSREPRQVTSLSTKNHFSVRRVCWLLLVAAGCSFCVFFLKTLICSLKMALSGAIFSDITIDQRTGTCKFGRSKKPKMIRFLRRWRLEKYWKFLFRLQYKQKISL